MHLDATILMIFLTIIWPNLVHLQSEKQILQLLGVLRHTGMAVGQKEVAVWCQANQRSVGMPYQHIPSHFESCALPTAVSQQWSSTVSANDRLQNSLLTVPQTSPLRIKKITVCIALHGKPISELRDVTCHMWSHSVTCHPTQVNVLCLSPSQ